MLALAVTAAQAEGRSDILIFPAAFWHETTTDGRTRSDVTATLDLFGTYEHERLRLLGEWFFTENGNEIQRLQVGWRFGEHDTVWIGRYHTPIGYWNTEYHHGTYLQTSISRPAIEAFEGQHGPLPTHYTGLLWEGLAELEEGSVHYSVAAGLGPVLDGALDPLDVAEPDHGQHDAGLMVNASWRPAAYDPRQLGAVLGRTRIPDQGHDREFTQDLAGLYGNWTWPSFRLTAAVFHVSGRFDGHQRERFGSGYAQLEWYPRPGWTPYARIEASTGADAEDRYLGHFDSFVRSRVLAGIRFDVGERNAVTFEVARFETLRRESNRIALQWSAYFP